MVDICVFGDSIAYGLYDKEGGWVDRLKRHVLQTAKDINVYNQSVSGDTTQDLLERCEAECAGREPARVVFAIGINDSHWLVQQKRIRTDPGEFKNNLSSLLRIARTFTQDVLFIGLTDIDEERVTPCPWKPSKAYYAKHTTHYNSLLREFCKEHDLTFLSLTGLLSPNDLEDGLHPNTRGHEKLFSFLKEKVA